MLKVTKRIIKGANILNWITGVTTAIALCIIFLSPDYFESIISYSEDYPQYNNEQIQTLYLIDKLDFTIVVITVPLIHIIFTCLVNMIEDLNAGVIFSEQNADRLKFIGWSLLFVQMTDIIYGWFYFKWLFTFEHEYGWQPGLNLIGWFAVLLIFILAKIFQQGASMRDDLEGTI